MFSCTSFFFAYTRYYQVDQNCRAFTLTGKTLQQQFVSISISYSFLIVMLFMHCRKNDCCCRCWRLMLWMDNWRKTLLYIVFGVPMFIRNLVTVYTVICGKNLYFFTVIEIIKVGLMYLMYCKVLGE